MGVGIGTNGIVWQGNQFRGTDLFGQTIRGAILEMDGDRPSMVMVNHFIRLSYEYNNEVRSVVPTSIKVVWLDSNGECMAPSKVNILKYEVLDVVNTDELFNPNARKPESVFKVRRWARE